MNAWVHICIACCPREAPDPVVTGIDGQALRAVRAEGVCVWVGDVKSSPQPDLDRIRAHDHVIRAAMATGHTPVPIRFGQAPGNDDELRTHLASRDYRADLERIAGCVEFGIRVLDPDAVDADPQPEPKAEAGSGAAYMRMLADRMHALERTRARALDVARELDRGLAQWVRESRVEPSDRPAGAVVAHLVQAASVDTYAARARGMSHERPPLRIVVTGPWPPYSFVE